MNARQPHDAEVPALTWQTTAPGHLLGRIRECAIVGMGGAGFPAHEKIERVLAHEHHEQKVVIANAIDRVHEIPK